MTNDELARGAALLAAARVPGAGYLVRGNEHACNLVMWLESNADWLIASARQAQDNAKDAGRYRWLRDPRHCDAIGDAFEDENDAGWGERLDAAIDAARKATPDKGTP